MQKKPITRIFRFTVVINAAVLLVESTASLVLAQSSGPGHVDIPSSGVPLTPPRSMPAPAIIKSPTIQIPAPVPTPATEPAPAPQDVAK
jgi:hypothetical protein